MNIEASTVREEIDRLNERLEARQRGDMIIRLAETYFSVSRNLVRSFPLSALLLLPGAFAEGILRSLEGLSPVILRSAENLSRIMSQLLAKLRRVVHNIGRGLREFIDRGFRR